MKNLLLSIFVVMAIFANGRAQTPPASAPAGPIVVHFKNGTSIASIQVRRAGGNIAVTVQLGGAGRSETSYPVGTVTRIDFPKPPAIAVAEGSLAANNAAAALTAISPVVQQQAGFQDIPGNWWARAAGIQVKALVALGRYADAEKAIDALSKRADPEELRAARLQVAIGWTKQGEMAKALPVFDDAIAHSASAQTLALAWVGRGNALLAKKDYDSALISFLRVPVFYPLEKAAQPPALLGSARALKGLEQLERARAVLDELMTTHGKSPEAVEAQADLKQINRKLNITTKTD